MGSILGLLGACFTCVVGAGALPMILGEPDTATHAAVLPFILTSVLMIMAMVTLFIKIKEKSILFKIYLTYV